MFLNNLRLHVEVKVVKAYLTLKMVPIHCPETSLTYYEQIGCPETPVTKCQNTLTSQMNLDFIYTAADG
jgi:hypothetical protein